MPDTAPIAPFPGSQPPPVSEAIANSPPLSTLLPEDPAGHLPRALGAEFAQAHRELEQRHLRLQEATSLADAEIRDQLLMHASATSTEFARTREALTADMTAKHTDLMTKKTDRVALARMLSDVARALGDSGSHTDADTLG